MTDYRHHAPNKGSLPEQLRAERARAARLAAELVVEQEKVRQLQDAFNHKDNEAWHQHETIETLKVELRSIATFAAQLQSRLLTPAPPAPALPASQSAAPADGAPPAAPASPAAQEADLGFRLALMDLEERLQQAVGLVLDELNTRKAAEARIGELEAQLAALRRRIHDAGG